MQTNKRNSSYNNYIMEEWNKFHVEPQRGEAMLKAVGNIQVNRVLDLGCGAGQEMLPFVVRGAKAIGIDTMLEAGQIGRELFKAEGFGQKVDFIRAKGQELPFANGTFDVLICRIALIYMPIKLALSEIERVCRKGAILFLKYHAPSYYWWKFREGLKSRNILSSVHAVRCIQAGYFYKMTGRQPFNKLTAVGETFITKKMLQHEFKLLSLKIIGEMPDTNSQTPSLIITKE